MRIRSLSLIVILFGLLPGILFAAPPVTHQWKSVPELSDEFDTFDREKWNDYHPGWRGRQPSAFKKSNAFVKDGNLCLRSTSRVKSLDEVKDPMKDVWVDAAAVSSKKKLAGPGHYYETSIKASDLSMTSSFWFRMGRFSEIDVIENIGRPTEPKKKDFETTMKMNTHLYRGGPYLKTPNDYEMGKLARDNFITFGVWWKSPDEIIFYCDDKLAATVKPGRPFNENLHMIFDTEVFTWAGLPTIESLNDPKRNTMQVDWVRAWKCLGEKKPMPIAEVKHRNGKTDV